MSIYEELGVRTIINAKGPSTRLSGGFLDDEVARAMVEASRHCVDIAELQAAASRIIAEITGPRPATSPPGRRPACSWAPRPASPAWIRAR